MKRVISTYCLHFIKTLFITFPVPSVIYSLYIGMIDSLWLMKLSPMTYDLYNNIVVYSNSLVVYLKMNSISLKKFNMKYFGHNMNMLNIYSLMLLKQYIRKKRNDSEGRCGLSVYITIKQYILCILMFLLRIFWISYKFELQPNEFKYKIFSEINIQVSSYCIIIVVFKNVGLWVYLKIYLLKNMPLWIANNKNIPKKK